MTDAVVPDAPDNTTVTTPSVRVMVPGLVWVVGEPGIDVPPSSSIQASHGAGDGGAGSRVGYVGVPYVVAAAPLEPAMLTATTETL